jgi:CheY-like chemotaxis protein
MAEPNKPSREQSPLMKDRLQFNRIMKEVDMFVREGKYEDALQRIAEAKEFDSNNLYIKAFEDRINTLKNAQKAPRPITPKVETPAPAVSPSPEIQAQERTRELEKYEAKRTVLLEELEIEREKLRIEREKMRAEGAEEIRKTKHELREEMDKKLNDRLEKLERDYARKIDLLGITAPKTHEERLAVYRAKMKQSYVNGEPSLEQARDLLDLKELLDLSFEDHVKIDTEVRVEQYVQVVEQGLIDGALTLDNVDILEELKQRFHILPEENARVETFILSKIRKHTSTTATILIADDEEDIRVPIGDALQGQGYNAIVCSDVAEALSKLETERVDLIVSDIKFLPGEEDGFQFFQAVQKNQEWESIPFILLSSLRDSVVVRSGLQLGVDDYLTKPVDIDLLLAVIEGKLKRQKSE